MIDKIGENEYMIDNHEYSKVIISKLGRKWIKLAQEIGYVEANAFYEVESLDNFASRIWPVLKYWNAQKRPLKSLLQLLLNIGCHDIANELIQVWKKEVEQYGNKIDHLLQHFPLMSDDHYIIRKELTDNICKQLKKIDQSEGQIFVYGPTGSGKTTTVCQAIRHVMENEGCFKLYGCYWLEIGDISDEVLASKLNKLGTDLDCPIQSNSLGTTIDLLNRFCASQVSEKLNTLIVFDNVHHLHHYRYLKLFKKSIIISKHSWKEETSGHECYQMPERLTRDEAVQLLAKYNKNLDIKALSNNKHVSEAIEACNGLPLAIKVISGLQIQYDKQWQQLTALIDHQPGHNPFTMISFPFHQLFQFSLLHLNSDERSRFRLLGVFNREPIPVESIQSLWKCSRTETTSLLNKFHQRSLLSYFPNHCLLHERIVDFLQQPADASQSPEDYMLSLHQALTDGYSRRCQRKWSTHPNDGYFYQNIVYHLQQAKDTKTLIDLLRDLNWVIKKITLNGVNDEEFLNLLDFCFTQKEMEIWNNLEELRWMIPADTNSNLEVLTADIVQHLLIKNSNRDNWINKQVLQLAKRNIMEKDCTYWKYAGLKYTSDEDTHLANSKPFLYKERKRWPIKIHQDEVIACSNPTFGDLRIAHTCYIEGELFLVVCDYYTSRIIHQIHCSSSAIQDVQISPNGSIIAYAYKQEASIDKWIIYDVNNKKQLVFEDQDNQSGTALSAHISKGNDAMDEDINETNKQTLPANVEDKLHPTLLFQSFSFHPADNNLVMTLSTDSTRTTIKIWKIENNLVRSTANQISLDYPIRSCQFISNGSKIMLWYRKYNNDASDEKQSKTWNNQCQIELWDTETCQRLKWFLIPSWIQKDGNRIKASTQFERGQSLKDVRFGGQSDIVLFLSYGKTLGLVNLQHKFDINLMQDFEKHFQPIQSDIVGSAFQITVSDDQQLVKISTSVCKDWIFNLTSGQLDLACNIVHRVCSKKAIFIPGSHDLLLTAARISHLYRYNLDAENHKFVGWTNINSISQNAYDSRHRQTELGKLNMAFFDDIPFVAQIIRNPLRNNLQLKTYQGKSFDKISYYDLDQECDQCVVCDGIKSVFLFGKYDYNAIEESSKPTVIHNGIRITEYVDIFNEQEITDHLKVNQYHFKVSNKIKSLTVKETRFRKRDQTLIFVIEAKLDQTQLIQILVITINIGSKIQHIYVDEELYDEFQSLYCDDDYLITFCAKDAKHIKYYKFDNGKMPVDCITSLDYDDDESMAYKVVLPSDPSTSDIDIFQYNQPDLDENLKNLDQWGEQDGNIILDCLDITRKACILIKNGEHLAAIDTDRNIICKGYKGKLRDYPMREYCNAENLWSNRYFATLCGKDSSDIYIYDSKSLEFLNALPLPNHCVDVKWNKNFSSFITTDRISKLFCITLVEADDVH